MHTLILGLTNTGKTTQAQKLATELQKTSNVLVLDPFKSSKWSCDFITSDPDLFYKVVFSNRSCHCFIDESEKTLAFDKQYNDFATFSRKFGHRFYFIGQRAQQMLKTIRTQCSSIFLFKQHNDDAKLLSRDFCDDALLESHTLKRGEYIFKANIDSPSRKCKIQGWNS